MSNEAITKYLNSIRQSYQKAKRREKARILEGAVLATRFSRKYLIRLLRADPQKKGPGRGRRPVYGPEVLGPLKAIWFLMEQPCAKKMKVLLPKILDAFVKRNPLPEGLQKKLLGMSAASIDRSWGISKTFSDGRSWNSRKGLRQ